MLSHWKKLKMETKIEIWWSIWQDSGPVLWSKSGPFAQQIPYAEVNPRKARITDVVVDFFERFHYMSLGLAGEHTITLSDSPFSILASRRT